MKRMAKGRGWTRDELVVAMNLYCKTPFGLLHERNPVIIALAERLDRTPGSLAMKLCNLASLDPVQQARGIKGLSAVSVADRAVWHEFHQDWAKLAFESERLLAQFTGRKLEEVAEIDERELPKQGLERQRMVRVRVNQYFFRATVLAAYDFKCCITTLAVRELLVASHIVPWANDPKQRMNPRNGLCLNALHDRAFDRGLMFIGADMTVRFREKLLCSEERNPGLDWLLAYEGKPICMPRRFKPDEALLSLHRSVNGL